MQQTGPYQVAQVADSIIEASVSSPGATNATLRVEPQDTVLNRSKFIAGDSVFQINKNGQLTLNSQQETEHRVLLTEMREAATTINRKTLGNNTPEPSMIIVEPTQEVSFIQLPRSGLADQQRDNQVK